MAIKVEIGKFSEEKTSPATSYRDRSGRDPEKMRVEDIELLLREIRNQPQWRIVADEEAGYYDNNQWRPEEIYELLDRGQPITTTNLIFPVINSLIGIEARSRTDFKVVSEREIDEDIDTAAALSVELKEAERMSKLDRACTEAYASLLKVGVGFVEVTRNPDPFKYKYRATAIHRNEIYWDWRAKDPLLEDARYLIRRRWIDLDAAELAFPQHKDLFQTALTSYNDWDSFLASATEDMMDQFGRYINSANWDAQEFVDTDRRRLCINEVWYRVWKRGLIIKMRNGEVAEYNKEDPAHHMAIAGGIATLEEHIFTKMRLSFWIGPHRLSDRPTPYPHNYFPYAPFFGFREDKSGVPYSLIRMMKSPQDEVNARKAKLLYLLSSKRAIVDGDAVDDHNQAREELARPDAYVILNEARQRDDGFRVETELSLSAQQFDVMKDSQQAIQDVVGIYSAMLGQDNKADSGIAINSLVDQGANSLGLLNDNYQSGRVRAGELLLSLIHEDLTGTRKPVKLNKDGLGKAKTVVLNGDEITTDTGKVIRKNDITRLRSKVVLEDVPASSTHRAQQFTFLMEITKSLPPEVMQAILPDIIMFSEMPNRKEVANNLRKLMGLSKDPDEMTPEEVKAQQDEARNAREIEQIERDKARFEMLERKAKAEEAHSKAAKAAAEAAIALVGTPEAAVVADDILDGSRAEETLTDHFEERDMKRMEDEQEAAKMQQSVKEPDADEAMTPTAGPENY